MTIPTEEVSQKDVIHYLICQQFYYGDDKIFGRTKDLFEVIPEAGKTIDEFSEKLLSLMAYLEKKEYKPLLLTFDNQIHPIPIDSIYQKFESHVTELGENYNQLLMITDLIGQSLVHIHTTCFNLAIAEIFTIVKNELLTLPHMKPMSPEQFDEKLHHLYARGDKHIGLIYSLSFMQFLAEKMKNREVSKHCTTALKKHYNTVKEKLHQLMNS